MRILKTYADSQGEEAAWGEQVHKHFEDFLADGVVLPLILQAHQPFLESLLALPGEGFVERAIGLDLKGQPCEFFAPDVWYRGKIDYLKVCGPQALIIDHKTGKIKNRYEQLTLFALWTFAAFPEVQTIRAEYYWTQTKTKNGDTFHRSQIAQLWAPFVPKLRQYAQSFIEDIWTPRQSGLCAGWCPVTDCEFWRPRRKRA